MSEIMHLQNGATLIKSLVTNGINYSRVKIKVDDLHCDAAVGDGHVGTIDVRGLSLDLHDVLGQGEGWPQGGQKQRQVER